MFVMLSVHTQCSVHERQKVETTTTTTTTTSTTSTTTTNRTIIPITTDTIINQHQNTLPSSILTTINNTTKNNNSNIINPILNKTITTATTTIPNKTRQILTVKLGSILLPNKYNNNNNNNNIKNINIINNNLINNNYNNSLIKLSSTNKKDKKFIIKNCHNQNEEIQEQEKHKENFSIINRLTKRKYFKIISSKKSNYLPKEDTGATQESVIIESELNNNRGEPTPVQVPVATILNDLSATPGVVKVKNKSTITSMSPMTPKGLPSDTPDIKAMRYYRLWIYTCNAVLLMGVIIFCGVAGKVLIADYRRLLVNDLNLGQPSFLYAYLALLVQSGFLQLIGCLGALRLSEKLLNAYWLLLLLLLIGDVLLGLFWLFKFDRIMETFEPILRNRFSTEYGISNEFSDLWDRLQNEGKCCGVIGPQDFTNKSYPVSCCTTGDITDQISVSRRPLASAVVFRSDDLSAQQKQNLSDIADSAWSHVVSETRGSGGSGGGTGVGGTVEPIKNTSTCRAVFPLGCRDLLAAWIRNTADILFVVGYCIIAFLKLSFLGILRYEIREMIQKIKLLQNETAAGLLEQELEPNQLTQVTNTSINGVLHTEPKVGNRDRERSRISSGESERESLLIHDNTPPNYLRNKHLYGCTDFGGGGGVGGGGGIPGGNTANPLISGNRSDSIAGTGISIHEPGPSCSSGARSKNSGSTNIHGIETDCPLIVEDSSASAAAKLLNNSNNYELTEFDTKAPTYRRVNPGPTVTKM